MTDQDALKQIKAIVDGQLTSPTPPPPGAGTARRFLQWNSHHAGLGTDGKYDPDRFATAIKLMNPDVVSLNEVDTAPSANGFNVRLQQRLGSKGTWRYGYDMRGNALYTPLTGAAFQTITINSAAPRYMEVMTLPDGWRVGNVHLELNDPAIRKQEVQAIVEAAPHIVLGDFNLQPSSPEYMEMATAYIDCWAEAKRRGTATNYPGNCDGCTKGSRIDYVWLRRDLLAQMATVTAEVVDTRDASGVMPSDHKPLLVTLGL